MRITICFIVALGVTGCQGMLDLASDDSSTEFPGESSEATAAKESDEAADDPAIVEPTDCTSTPAPVRRRTNEEFQFAVEDTFDVSVDDLVAELPEDPRVDGFVNTAPALTVDARRIRAYLDVVEQIAARIDWQPWFDRHAPCQSTEAACRDNWIEGLGEEVIGRPLAEEEVAPFRDVFDSAAAGDGGFEDGATAVAQALMVSPQFLFRLEPSDVGPHEFADRLAFLVWQAPADEWLREKASSGALDDEESIRQVVDEMMEDPRARRSLHRFVQDWLHLSELDRQVRDPEKYPEFSADLASAMARETHHLFDRLVWEEDADMLSALTSNRTFIDDPALAELYGFEPRGAPGEVVEYSLTDTGRAGVLGHASVLTLNAQNDHEKMIYRGLFVLETALCGQVSAPNPELLENNPIEIDETWSARKRAEARLEADQCAGCHAQFEPLAFAMEPFDAIGASRTVDDHGHEVRSDGDLPFSEGETAFGDIEEFGQLLAARDEVSQCFARKGVRFAWGRALESEDRCVAEQVAAEFEENGRTWRSLILAIATHPRFRAAGPNAEEVQ